MRTLLEAAQKAPAGDAEWVDIADAMSDERVAAALVSLVELVVAAMGGQDTACQPLPGAPEPRSRVEPPAPVPTR